MFLFGFALGALFGAFAGIVIMSLFQINRNENE
jgi:hypothetical protein